MSKTLTLTILKPNDQNEEKLVNHHIEKILPYCTGLSIEDEITILELIENHPDFQSHIAEWAREEAKKLQDKFIKGELK